MSSFNENDPRSPPKSAAASKLEAVNAFDSFVVETPDQFINLCEELKEKELFTDKSVVVVSKVFKIIADKIVLFDGSKLDSYFAQEFSNLFISQTTNQKILQPLSIILTTFCTIDSITLEHICNTLCNYEHSNLKHLSNLAYLINIIAQSINFDYTSFFLKHIDENNRDVRRKMLDLAKTLYSKDTKFINKISSLNQQLLKTVSEHLGADTPKSVDEPKVKESIKKSKVHVEMVKNFNMNSLSIKNLSSAKWKERQKYVKEILNNLIEEDVSSELPKDFARALKERLKCESVVAINIDIVEFIKIYFEKAQSNANAVKSAKGFVDALVPLLNDNNKRLRQGVLITLTTITKITTLKKVLPAFLKGLENQAQTGQIEILQFLLSCIEDEDFLPALNALVVCIVPLLTEGNNTIRSLTEELLMKLVTKTGMVPVMKRYSKLSTADKNLVEQYFDKLNSVAVIVTENENEIEDIEIEKNQQREREQVNVENEHEEIQGKHHNIVEKNQTRSRPKFTKAKLVESSSNSKNRSISTTESKPKLKTKTKAKKNVINISQKFAKTKKPSDSIEEAEIIHNKHILEPLHEDSNDSKEEEEEKIESVENEEIEMKMRNISATFDTFNFEAPGIKAININRLSQTMTPRITRIEMFTEEQDDSVLVDRLKKLINNLKSSNEHILAETHKNIAILITETKRTKIFASIVDELVEGLTFSLTLVFGDVYNYNVLLAKYVLNSLGVVFNDHDLASQVSGLYLKKLIESILVLMVNPDLLTLEEGNSMFKALNRILDFIIKNTDFHRILLTFLQLIFHFYFVNSRDNAETEKLMKVLRKNFSKLIEKLDAHSIVKIDISIVLKQINLLLLSYSGSLIVQNEQMMDIPILILPLLEKIIFLTKKQTLDHFSFVPIDKGGSLLLKQYISQYLAKFDCNDEANRVSNLYVASNPQNYNDEDPSVLADNFLLKLNELKNNSKNTYSNLTFVDKNAAALSVEQFTTSPFNLPNSPLLTTSTKQKVSLNTPLVNVSQISSVSSDSSRRLQDLKQRIEHTVMTDTTKNHVSEAPEALKNLQNRISFLMNE
eukprot:TRINITY_DN2521_c0_g1_i1.p1 TRINITY_DN2521_c0_g1~~TRINITY_DN2521_c0_g1_i1.p1  ORF type:complete len:1078 (+),score=324.98 TRINITY_DN2521_c0_g1_i1:29-3235(+)